MPNATDTTYNGWANYATWRVNLDVFDGYDPEGVPVSGEILEEMVEELLTMDGNKNPLAIDYARAFLSDVQWDEIAHRINADYDLTDENN